MTPMSDEQNWPVAVDPHGCGCTECLIGQYVPEERATPAQLVAVLTGEIGNNVGVVDITFARYEGQWLGVRSFSLGSTFLHTSDLDDELADHLRRMTPDDIGEN